MYLYVSETQKEDRVFRCSLWPQPYITGTATRASSTNSFWRTRIWKSSSPHCRLFDQQIKVDRPISIWNPISTTLRRWRASLREQRKRFVEPIIIIFIIVIIISIIVIIIIFLIKGPRSPRSERGAQLPAGLHTSQGGKPWGRGVQVEDHQRQYFLFFVFSISLFLAVLRTYAKLEVSWIHFWIQKNFSPLTCGTFFHHFLQAVNGNMMKKSNKQMYW